MNEKIQQKFNVFNEKLNAFNETMAQPTKMFRLFKKMFDGAIGFIGLNCYMKKIQ